MYAIDTHVFWAYCMAINAHEVNACIYMHVYLFVIHSHVSLICEALLNKQRKFLVMKKHQAN